MKKKKYIIITTAAGCTCSAQKKFTFLFCFLKLSNNMELDYDTVLDIALGGPEIGPLNLVTLHGLLRELFSKTGISKKEITIEEEDPIFGDAYKFIHSKVNKRPRTAGGGYHKLQSRVSVIVSDYAKSAIGQQQQQHEEKPKAATLLPADVEERLK